MWTLSLVDDMAYVYKISQANKKSFCFSRCLSRHNFRSKIFLSLETRATSYAPSSLCQAVDFSEFPAEFRGIFWNLFLPLSPSASWTTRLACIITTTLLTNSFFSDRSLNSFWRACSFKIEASDSDGEDRGFCLNLSPFVSRSVAFSRVVLQISPPFSFTQS